MQLTIITPEKTVLNETVTSIQAQATDGWFGILPQHIPMVTPLRVSVLRYKTVNDETHQMAVMGGLLQTDGKTTQVLCDAAETATEIDVLRARQAKERAEARLKNSEASVVSDRAQIALTRSLARLQAAGKA